MKSFALFYLLISISTIVNSQYSELTKIISSGSEESIGNNYSNFGIIGETFIGSSFVGKYKIITGFVGSFQENSTTFIHEINNFEINIYPIPARDKLIINTDEKIDKIILYDCFGKVLFENKQTSEIDVSKFSSGIYFLEIEIEKKKFRKKVLIE